MVLDKTYPGISKYLSQICWWAGGCNNRSSANWISGCRKSIQMRQQLAEKGISTPNSYLIPTQLLAENYMCLLASLEH